MPETILVAVADPSSNRQPVIERAAQLAVAAGARLVLFHAVFESALSGRPFFDSSRLARSRGVRVAQRTQALERRARALRASGINVDICVVWEEPAHEAIVRAALREKADLVVAGRHERRANSPVPFRLTDWELMRLCPRPLLVVHPSSRANGTGAVLTSLDPTHAYDKPADLDISIVKSGAAFAEVLRTECHAMHCVLPSAYPLGATTTERKRFDQRMYSRMKQIVKKAGADVKAIHLAHGDVVTSLPGLARKLPAQIVVMGIISRRWMQRLVIGDTAESVIRDMPCDLLLIKPDRFRVRLGRSRKQDVVLPKTKSKTRR